MSQAPAGTGPTLRAGEGHARKGRPLHARYTPATHSLYVWPAKHPLHVHDDCVDRVDDWVDDM